MQSATPTTTSWEKQTELKCPFHSQLSCCLKKVSQYRGHKTQKVYQPEFQAPQK